MSTDPNVPDIGAILSALGIPMPKVDQRKAERDKLAADLKHAVEIAGMAAQAASQFRQQFLDQGFTREAAEKMTVAMMTGGTAPAAGGKK